MPKKKIKYQELVNLKDIPTIRDDKYIKLIHIKIRFTVQFKQNF